MTDLRKYVDSLTGDAAKALADLREVRSAEDMETEARAALGAFSEYAVEAMERADADPDDKQAVAMASAAVAVQRGDAMALGVHFVTSDGTEHRKPFIASTGATVPDLYDSMMEILEEAWDGKSSQPYLVSMVQIVAALTVVVRDGETEEEATRKARKADAEGDRVLSSSVVMVDGRIGTLLADTDGPEVKMEWMHNDGSDMKCSAMHPSEALVLRYLTDSGKRHKMFQDRNMEGWTTEGWCDPTHNTKPDGDNPVTDMES